MISETYRRVKRKDGVICFRDLKRWRGKTRGGEGERVRGGSDRGGRLLPKTIVFSVASLLVHFAIV